MFGLGTIINVAGILLGGLLGLCFGKLLKDRHQETLTRVCGVSTLFIGIGGALEGMLSMDGGRIVSGNAMLIVICLSLGALIGEILEGKDDALPFAGMGRNDLKLAKAIDFSGMCRADGVVGNLVYDPMLK